MLLKLKRLSVLVSILSVALAFSYVGIAAADSTTVTFACSNNSTDPVIGKPNAKHQVSVTCPSKAKIITNTTTSGKKLVSVRASCSGTQTAEYTLSTTSYVFFCTTTAGKAGSNPTVAKTANPASSTGGSGGGSTTAPENVTDKALTSGNCDDINHCQLITKYIDPLIKFLAAGVGIAVVISIIIGGIQYGSSAGDSQKVTAAKERIRNAIIALVAFAFMYTILNFLLPGGI